MDFLMLSSKGVTDDLKCALCNNFLSYFPIYNSENQNVCGRCTLPQEKLSFRNNLYEVIAQWLRFPCRYKHEGCEEQLLPEEMPQHEKTCVYRRIQCAVADLCHCDWTGSFRDLIQHCRDEHIDRILQNGEFEVDLQHNSERINLLEYNNQLLHVESKFDSYSKFFELAVYHLQVESDNEQYRFHLILKNGTRNVSMEINTTEFNEKCFVDVCIDLLKNRADNLPSPIQAKIAIKRDYELNRKILKLLECWKCSELIIPPFSHCVSGKTLLCSECHEKHLPTCESCKLFSGNAEDLKDLRINNFEQIMDLCNYTCKNRKHGCTVVAKPSEMLKHHSVCPFREVGCVFGDCEWKDLIEKITSHVETSHQDAIVLNSSEISLQLHKKNLKIIKSGGKMFSLCVSGTTELYLVVIVQEIGTTEFRHHRMNIFNKKNSTQTLGVTSRNNSSLLPEDVKSERFVYSLLSLDQVKKFTEENWITFEIDIL